uniref:Cyclodipeptide synthase n=1 Tax=Candidatus Kentrum eta TaxID=2126337 RepID=A0A450UNW4_9GAMM|nr:MAG: tRNA-dependent cyclodipeptide synthase [Candidatus Kentron sp. H]VFJ94805.1 MAG: tRNA-dependent cyclodipeptide synthase [Candidatus Kentron sp. H]VFK01923.1 MAG: tRNA-dependent cyclodipeptide synthase [Candidatus Kentron sp. H]
MKTHDMNSAWSNRYKAKVDRVSPHSERNTFERLDRCFLGVSLQNRNFARPKLAGIVQWIGRRFPHCTVLVADTVHRITLEVTQGLAPEVALIEALALGQEFIHRERCVFEHWSEQTEFSFVTCGEIRQRPAYGGYHRELVRLFETDIPFSESMESFGHAYYRGRSAHLDPEQSIRRSVDYFLEELAVFACLQQEGLPVMVYPGSLGALAEIPEGLHPGAPRELLDLIVVSLRLKGRGSA